MKRDFKLHFRIDSKRLSVVCRLLTINSCGKSKDFLTSAFEAKLKTKSGLIFLIIYFVF